MHALIGACEQAAEQLDADPTSVSVVHATPSLQLAGQSPSHVSDPSTTPLPQLAEQSLSFKALHPGAQQPSASVHASIGAMAQRTSQVSAEPVRVSAVHATPSSQVVEQSPSQVSGAWTTPSPHVGTAESDKPASIAASTGVAESGARPASTGCCGRESQAVNPEIRARMSAREPVVIVPR